MTVYDLIKTNENNCANIIFEYICINFLKVNRISAENEYVLDELTKVSSFLKEELSEKEIEVLQTGNII